jgi:hypothetical protein
VRKIKRQFTKEDCIKGAYGKWSGKSPQERFSERYIIDPKTGCWNWTGSINGKGYGYLSVDNRTMQAYKLAYEWKYGKIPRGLELDHLCRNSACVNPDHLEVVTRRINQLRGNTIGARNAQKTHCPYGHPYSNENTYIKPDGSRACKKCKSQWRRRKSAL